MSWRTLTTWVPLVLVMLVGLLVSGGMSDRAAAGALTNPAPAHADIAADVSTTDSTAVWRSNGPYGGEVRALALSPAFNTDGFALAGGWRRGYYGITGGYGIVRTTDGGASWQHLGSEGHSWPVYDLAISPGFSADGTAYAGTEVGLVRTIDRGDSWLTLWGGLPGCEHGSNCTIARVWLSPNFVSDDAMLALQRGGNLYRSLNRGDAWIKILEPVVTAAAFSRDYATNHILFAALPNTEAGTTSVMRAVDDGGSWVWETFFIVTGPVNDILETVEGALLLATGDGVVRLVPDGAGYVEDPVSADIPGPVERLAVAGDNIYAAAQDGLYISLSFGRGWNRYDDTPAMPFRAVAPCPQWGVCHALMAGTDTGILFTPDDNQTAWRWLPGLQPVKAHGVAASGPATLFVASDQGVYRSRDNGATWQLLTTGAPLGDDLAFLAVQPSPGYATDRTIFATFVNNTAATKALYRSIDDGATWTILPGVGNGLTLAVSPAYPDDRTLFIAGGDQLYKSTDGGATWNTYPIAPPDAYFITFRLAVSPAYATDRTLFATGFMGTWRSTDGGVTWSAAGGPAPSYGLAMSPDYAADGTAWLTYRFIEGVGDGTPDSGVARTTDRGGTWRLATAGLPGTYEPFPIPLAASPNYPTDKALFTALSGQFVSGAEHSLYRAIGGGEWWVGLGSAPGNPDMRDLAVTAPGPGGGLTVHAATSAGVWHYDTACAEQFINGGFEENAGWLIKSNPVLASYVPAPTHSGNRSMRTGIRAGGANVKSYSPIEQAVTFPTGLASATLSFWRYNVNGDVGTSVPSDWQPDPATLPRTEAAQPDAVQAADYFYAIAILPDGAIDYLFTEAANAPSWRSKSIALDIGRYAGKTIRFQFGTYNDGAGGISRTFVDDASLVFCWAEVTPGPMLPRAYLPLVLKSPAVTPPPTVTPTPTPTATPPPPPSACYEGLVNGGFETDAGWLIKSNPVLAGYVTTPVHGGLRSMRTGIPAGGANLKSYSPIEQAVTFPTGLASATLSFWRYNVNGDVGASVPSDWQPDPATLPRTEAAQPDAIQAADFFYAIAILPDGTIDYLFTEAANAPSWRSKSIALNAGRYAGKTIRFQFGTYNDGAGGISRTFVDDASLTLCSPDGALMLPAGWARRVIGRPDSTTLYADAGGVLYRSDDAGATWRVSGTARPEHTILAANPNVLYAGDGYPCYQGGPDVPMWRTVDGGATWQQLPAGLNLKPLAAHPTDQRLYAAGCNGPYLSTDGGASFTLQSNELFGLYDVHFLAPVAPAWSTVWAGGVSEGGGGAVFRSSDGGGAWSQSTPLGLDMAWLHDLALDRFAAGRVYAPAYHGFYYTPDNGLHWTSASAGLEGVLDPGGGAGSYGLGPVAQDPTGPPHQLFLGTVRGLYRGAPGSGAWTKITGQPFDALSVGGLLLLDAAPARLYVTTPLGVFLCDTCNSVPPAPTATPTATPTPAAPPYVLSERWLRSLVVAPGENGRLYGVASGGFLLTSLDRGETWQPVNQPLEDDGQPSPASAVGMDYNRPETLYLSTNSGIWRSTNGGLSWELRAAGYFGAVTVDMDDPNVLWSGNPAPVRSTDGGTTWWPANEGFDGNLLSPILIDPQAHDLRYAVSQTPGGGGFLYRRTDNNMWDKVDGAPVGGWPDGYAGPGLALDGGTRALYLGNPNGTLYVSPNPYALAKPEIIWTPVKVFAYQPIPLAVGGSPSNSALYITLHNYGGASPLGLTLRSDDGGVTWLPLTIPPPPPAPTATPTPTATVPPPPGACYEALVNGGFETSAGWLIKSNPVLAGYVTTPVHGGNRSMRTGIPAGGANVLSYSPIEQAVSFPAGLASATLGFWRYNVNGDAPAAAGFELDPATLPRTEAERPDAVQAADYFYAIAILPDGAIDYLFTETANAPSWRSKSIALNAGRYAGKTVRFQFGTYNNGTGGISRTFVDDASLTLCPTGSSTPTATPTLTLTPAPTPTSDATPYPTPAGYPTAAPQVWPTPYKFSTVSLGAGSHPHGIAISPLGDRVYIALHGADHSGRELLIYDPTLSWIAGRVQLDTRPAGPNGVAIVPVSGTPLGYLVGVANRQTDELLLVEPSSRTVHRRYAVGDMPDGVISQGDLIYAASYGSDLVNLVDRTTLEGAGAISVGHEPALFAADPDTGDIFLSLHGADRVARIHANYVAGEYTDVPAPYGLAFDPTDRRLYVANRGANHKVTVLDVDTAAILGAIDVGREPYVVAVNPDTGHLFVACGDEVKVYDTFDWSFIAAIPVPAGAEEGIAVDSDRDWVYVTSREGDVVTVIQDAGPPLVLFTSTRDGNGEIYRMLPDGRRQQRLTYTDNISEGQATGSPDGRWIAYTRNMPDDTWLLWLMNRNGRNARCLFSGGPVDFTPTWSPDGKFLAFSSYRDGNQDIYKIEIATGLVTRLTTDAAADSNPDWAWTNGQIAFQSNRRTGVNPELFRMNADGSDVRQITTNINGDVAPSWSPSIYRLTFWGSRAEQTIYRTESDGTGIVPLVSHVVRPDFPHWGPGAAGAWIVFTGYRPGSGYSEVFRMNFDGSDLVLLTWNETDFDSATGWLP